MIDLHMHTNYSDGTDTVIELLKKAEDKELKYISITDHNNCYAYDELKKINVNEYFSGKIIKGVELNTYVENIPIELLGYGIDTDIINEEVKKMYITKEQKNKIELKQLLIICGKLGIKFAHNFEENYNKSQYAFASSYVLNEIKKNKENRKFFLSEETWKNDMKFYRFEMCNRDSNFYIDNIKILPKVEDVIQLIKKSGGLVFVPHIYIYGNNSEKIFKSIIKNYKVDGFECYHGKTKPNIDLGTGINGNLNISEEIINNWKSKI